MHVEMNKPIDEDSCAYVQIHQGRQLDINEMDEIRTKESSKENAEERGVDLCKGQDWEDFVKANPLAVNINCGYEKVIIKTLSSKDCEDMIFSGVWDEEKLLEISCSEEELDCPSFPLFDLLLDTLDWN